MARAASKAFLRALTASSQKRVGLCPALLHRLAYEGQPCDLCEQEQRRHRRRKGPTVQKTGTCSTSKPQRKKNKR